MHSKYWRVESHPLAVLIPLKTVHSSGTKLMIKWHTMLYKLMLLGWGGSGTLGYSITKFCAKILPLASNPRLGNTDMITASGAFRILLSSESKN